MFEYQDVIDMIDEIFANGSDVVNGLSGKELKALYSGKRMKIVSSVEKVNVYVDEFFVLQVVLTVPEVQLIIEYIDDTFKETRQSFFESTFPQFDPNPPVTPTP